MNSDKIILDLCGGSGSWAKPYKDAGYDVRTITLPDGDVRTYTPPEGVYGILAAPPCTEFSVVRRGAVEKNHGPRNLERGMEVVRHCQRIIEQAKPVWWAMENPRGHLRDFLGRPPLTFQPWQYGDPWTKCTDIWGNYKIPAPIYMDWADVPKNERLYIRKPRKKPNMVWFHKSSYDLIPAYHGLPRPTTDAGFRAMTPQGFARAFFEANPMTATKPEAKEAKPCECDSEADLADRPDAHCQDCTAKKPAQFDRREKP